MPYQPSRANASQNRQGIFADQPPGSSTLPAIEEALANSQRGFGLPASASSESAPEQTAPTGGGDAGGGGEGGGSGLQVEGADEALAGVPEPLHDASAEVVLRRGGLLPMIWNGIVQPAKGLRQFGHQVGDGVDTSTAAATSVDGEGDGDEAAELHGIDFAALLRRRPDAGDALRLARDAMALRHRAAAPSPTAPRGGTATAAAAEGSGVQTLVFDGKNLHVVQQSAPTTVASGTASASAPASATASASAFPASQLFSQLFSGAAQQQQQQQAAIVGAGGGVQPLIQLNGMPIRGLQLAGMQVAGAQVAQMAVDVQQAADGTRDVQAMAAAEGGPQGEGGGGASESRRGMRDVMGQLRELLQKRQQQQQQHPASVVGGAAAPASAPLSALTVGERVRVAPSVSANSASPEAHMEATVRYVGETHFKSGEWIGLQLDEPRGRNDGSVDGVRYFTCEPLHGLFVRRTRLHPSRLPPRSIWDEWRETAEVGDGRCPLQPLPSPSPPPEPEATSAGAEQIQRNVWHLQQQQQHEGEEEEPIVQVHQEQQMEGSAAEEGAAAMDGVAAAAALEAADAPAAAEAEEAGEAGATDAAADLAGPDSDSAASASTGSGGTFASVVVLGRGLGPRGASTSGQLSHHFPDLRRNELHSAAGVQPGAQQGGGEGLLTGLLQSVGQTVGASSGHLPFLRSVSSGLNLLFGNGGATHGGQQPTDPMRPRLADIVIITKAHDPREGQKATVAQDDRDAQPYRLLFADGSLSEVFYRQSHVTLHAKGIRPFLGDQVLVMRPGDKRRGEAAEVVQDDYDAQPYRLRFADGTLSDTYYRADHVALTDEVQAARRAFATPTHSGMPALPGVPSDAANTAGASSAASGGASGAAGGARETGTASGRDGGGDGREGGDGSATASRSAASPPPEAYSSVRYSRLSWLLDAMRRRSKEPHAPRSLGQSVWAEMGREESRPYAAETNRDTRRDARRHADVAEDIEELMPGV